MHTVICRRYSLHSKAKFSMRKNLRILSVKICSTKSSIFWTRYVSNCCYIHLFFMSGWRFSRPREIVNVLQRHKTFPNASQHALEPETLDLRLHKGAACARKWGVHRDFLPLERHPAIREWDRACECSESADQDHWWVVRAEFGEVH